jgi:hypothetical protein
LFFLPIPPSFRLPPYAHVYMDGIKETILAMNGDNVTLTDRLEGLEGK